MNANIVIRILLFGIRHSFVPVQCESPHFPGHRHAQDVPKTQDLCVRKPDALCQGDALLQDPGLSKPVFLPGAALGIHHHPGLNPGQVQHHLHLDDLVLIADLTDLQDPSLVVNVHDVCVAIYQGWEGEVIVLWKTPGRPVLWLWCKTLTYLIIRCQYTTQIDAKKTLHFVHIVETRQLSSLDVVSKYCKAVTGY